MQNHYLADKLNRHSPRLVRILARQGGKPMSLRAISKAAGLSFCTVQRIINANKWEHLTLATIDAFHSACGFNPFNVSRVNEFLKRQEEVNKTAFPYLKRSTRPDHFGKLMES